VADELPDVIARCNTCGKHVASLFRQGWGWVEQPIELEKATALVLLGVPFRHCFCDACSGFPATDPASVLRKFSDD